MTKEERERLLTERLAEMKAFEQELFEKGIRWIAGVDEVGRGPLAGPVAAAAVVLPADFELLGVDDSKKLSEKKRESLFEGIKNAAVCWGIGIVDNRVIDGINILEATKKAMTIAVLEADEALKRQGIGNKIEHILIDALTLPDIKTPQTGIVKGDSRSVSIAAASILAKVTRDRMMVKYHEEYPGYAFDRNKGYGTKAHYAGLDSNGACPLHRMTFLRKYYNGLHGD